MKKYETRQAVSIVEQSLIEYPRINSTYES